MRFTVIVQSVAGFALLTSPAQAKSLRKLDPSGQWVVDYADDTCRLAREFGEGNKRITLILEQFVPGDVFVMSLAGKPFNPYGLTGSDRATVRFGPNELPDENNSVRTALLGSVPAVLLGSSQRLAPYSDAEKAASQQAAKDNVPYRPPPIGAAREQAATWLQLSKVLPYDVELETGPMDKPLEALRQCSWDTIRSWGLSVDEQKALTRQAYTTTPGNSWFSPSDYPSSMLVQGYEGIVNFRVLVEADGTPFNCHVQSSTRPQAFDDVVCRQILKKARFHPALDAAGKPVRSYYRQTVLFRFAKPG